MGQKLGEEVINFCNLARARRSRTFPMVLRLDIGLKFDMTVASRFGFFRRGVTCANLREEGKDP